MSRAGPLLAARGITKSFGGVKALDGVSFELQAGEVHALCGENGAGKSTLIKVLSGIHPYGSFGGTILLDGQEVRLRSYRDAERAGVSVIYQELATVDALSVAENIFLGAAPRRGWFLDWPRMAREAGELLERFGIAVDPETPAGVLGVGRKQVLEILKAIRKRSRILILDEPTAALGETEARILLALVRQLAREGVACLYISHRLEEIRAVADRITVLRDGRSVAAFASGAAEPAAVVRAMVGRAIRASAPRRPPAAMGPALLEVDGLDVAAAAGRGPSLQGISFQVRGGEVVGLGGLMGAGRSELLMHLYGMWGVRLHGAVRLAGAAYADPTPGESLRRGLALMAEDRRRYGLVPDRSVEFNLTLSVLRRVTRRGLIDAAEEARLHRRMVEALRIRCADPEAPIRSLSGGNQQKVLLGRALLLDPAVVLLDEPTRGIDIAAKREIYELINRLTDGGKAVLLVSSELPELLGMSDRVLVLQRGRLAAELARDQFTQERFLAAALGPAREGPR